VSGMRHLPAVLCASIPLAMACGGGSGGTGAVPDGGGGGSSGGSSSGGGSGGDGGGAAQDAGSIAATCSVDGGSWDWNPTETSTVHGTNGTIVSACDNHGDLVQPVCETQQNCSGFPNPSCTVTTTGRVVTLAVSCAGHCIDGACDGRCPAQADRFTSLSSDGAGSVVIRDENSARRYACTVAFSAPGVDCNGGVHAGAQGTIQGFTEGGTNPSPGGAAYYCTGTDFGNLPITLDGIAAASPYQNEACALTCGVAP
jgi:hypothetical protein